MKEEGAIRAKRNDDAKLTYHDGVLLDKWLDHAPREWLISLSWQSLRCMIAHLEHLWAVPGRIGYLLAVGWEWHSCVPHARGVWSGVRLRCWHTFVLLVTQNIVEASGCLLD